MKFSSSLAIASAIGLASAAPALENRQDNGVVTTCNRGIALTYDDGPYIYDYNINDVYNGNDAKTTMFVNGYNWDCIYDPEYVSHIRAMYENGHLIASHTWSHIHLPSLTNEEIDTQVQLIEDALFKIIGVVPKYIRPPYGEVDQRVIDHLHDRWGLTIVNWSDDSEDAVGASDEQIMDLYNGIAGDGSHTPRIVLNHAVKDAASHLPNQYVPQLKNAGYDLLTVAQCLDESPYKLSGYPYQERDETWTCEGKPAPGKAQ